MTVPLPQFRIAIASRTESIRFGQLGLTKQNNLSKRYTSEHGYLRFIWGSYPHLYQPVGFTDLLDPEDSVIFVPLTTTCCLPQLPRLYLGHIRLARCKDRHRHYQRYHRAAGLLP